MLGAVIAVVICCEFNLVSLEILVKKSFGERRKRKQHRNWKLRKLLHEGEGSVGSDG